MYNTFSKIDVSNEKLITGTVREQNYKPIKNAVVVLSINYKCNVSCQEKKHQIGYSVTNNDGNFLFLINFYEFRHLNGIFDIKIFKPLNTLEKKYEI